ncbi:MAG: hypothetical protein EZS28_038063 [Streblomastix strix]|uniref:Transmembrane protein n=1 Tax=Streblomastix strix TaxID=222440 RepID=A0A5J4U877_9EUKA|nr:MAG: hypothetical protein EZS28_038063 [Streblomastix strix]
MAVVNIGAGAYLVVKIHKLSIYDVVIGDCGLFISFQMIFRIYFDIKKAQVLFTKKKKDENKEKKEKDKEDKIEKEKEEKKEKELELEIYKKNQRTAKIIISLVLLYIILYAAGFAIGYFSIQKKFDLFLSNDEKEILAISQKRIEDNKEDQIEESDEDVNIKETKEIKDIKPQRIEKQEQKQQQEQKEFKEEDDEEEIPLERGEDESSEKELDEEIKVNKNNKIKSNETDNKDKDNNITDKKPTQQPIKIDCQVTGVCYECLLTSWGLLILLFIGSAATLAAAWWEEKEDFRGIVEEVCAVPKFRKGKKKNKAK